MALQSCCACSGVQCSSAIAAPIPIIFLHDPLSHQSAKNAQIAAPQRATNQASESQTSTSSRFMIGSECWFSREVRYSAALMRYLSTRTQSCYCAPMICYSVPIDLRFRASAVLFAFDLSMTATTCATCR